MLVHTKGSHHHNFVANLHNKQFEGKDEDNDEDEDAVVEEVEEGVDLFAFKEAAIEEVKDGKENQHVEEESEMLTVSVVPVGQFDAHAVWHVKDVITVEEHDAQYNDLIDRIENDVTPHLRVDDVLGSGVRLTGQQLLSGWVGGEGKGSEGVHDQVDPKHLHGGERGVLENCRPKESHEERHHIDSQLELQEFPHTVEDVPPVLDSSDDGTEVVVEQDDACCLLGHLRACDSHCEADICLFEGGCVVGAVAGHGYNVLEVLEAGGEVVLVGGGGACQYSKLVCDFLELLHVADLLFLLSVLLVFN